MSEKLSFDDLKKKGQGLQEVITIASKCEELMQAMMVLSQSLLQGKLTLFVDTIIQRAQQIV